MDMEKMLKLMLGSDALGPVSEQAGLSQEDTAQVIETVLPMLLKGMQGQAKNQSTQKGFLEALSQHGKEDTSDVNKFLKNVDTEDGAKIVKHLLGTEENELAAKATKKSGIDTKTILKIMAIIAPLLMSQMGKDADKKKSKGKNDDMIDIVTGLLDGVDVGDVLRIAGKLLG